MRSALPTSAGNALFRTAVGMLRESVKNLILTWNWRRKFYKCSMDAFDDFFGEEDKHENLD